MREKGVSEAVVEVHAGRPLARERSPRTLPPMPSTSSPLYGAQKRATAGWGGGLKRW
jgi:hypothetical protein